MLRSTLNRCALPALFSLITLVLILAPLTPSAAREFIPTPPDGGEGLRALPEDNAAPFTPPSDPDWLDAREEAMMEKFMEAVGGEKDLRSVEIGGDDVQVALQDQLRRTDIDIAENGDIYVAAEVYNPAGGGEIWVYRSQDEGNSFTLWGNLTAANSGGSKFRPSIVVAEGDENRFYVAYLRVQSAGDIIGLRYADLAGATASWSAETIAMTNVGDDFDHPHLATDSESWDSYYLYLVATGDDGNGQDIWYARSTNLGLSFEPAYEIATLAFSDRAYSFPKICWGYGGYVHAVWYITYEDHIQDDSVRYRRCAGDGGGGLDAWDYWVTMTSATNGIEENGVEVAASLDSPAVKIAYERKEYVSENNYIFLGLSSTSSSNSGETWSTPVEFNDGLIFIGDLQYQSSTGNFVLAGWNNQTPALQMSPDLLPDQWSEIQVLGDQSYLEGIVYGYHIALDPSHDGRIAAAWSHSWFDVDPDIIYFDAQWHADEGYPNFEDGFPLDLAEPPLSAPAVVDLDGNGDLEIVFTDTDNNIQVFDHDGTTHPGWPVPAGSILSTGAAAIGDLNGDGQQSVVVGTADGQVLAFDPGGSLLPGFPSSFPDAVPVHVSIGALGGPYPRTIVAVGGERLVYLNYRGVAPLDTHGWNLFGQNIIYPAAIGDVNGDGISEVVVTGTDVVFAVNMYEVSYLWSVSLLSPASDPATLGDIDLDGDMEVAIPCEDGTLYLKTDDGSDYPGFPVSSSSSTPLTSAAFAQIYSSLEPDLIFAARDWTLEVFQHTGESIPLYPQSTGIGWFLHGAPIAGNIDSFPAEVIIGSRDNHMWAKDNLGGTPPGWPKAAGDFIELSPAMGDLDQDGSSEIVFLSEGQLLVVDVNAEAVQAPYRWPMFGHDPQRTGCHNCPEDLLTPVDDDPEGEQVITRVSFAAPAPNPTSGSTLFSYELPVRAQVRLDVYDLRGHRVRSVFREEVPAGGHAITWDGRDQQGRQVSSGIYFARLNVRGPGLDRQLSRKVNVLR